MNRRTFMQALGGAYLVNGNASVSYGDVQKNDNAVIFLFLGGGATHIETFNPIPNAPVERRSSVGHISTSIPGIEVGGLFGGLSSKIGKVSIVRSFSHQDPNHETATHWVIGGEKNQGGTSPKYPSYGAMTAGYYGPVSKNGLPTYIKMNRIDGDGAAWMGQKYMGYDAGVGVGDLQLRSEKSRFLERTSVLQSIELNSKLGSLGKEWSEFQNQASDAILGKAGESFRVQEDPEFEQYKNDQLGKDILSAIRAVENGSKFVNINFPGWDMHDNIVANLNARQTILDRYLSLLLTSLERRLLSKRVMFVMTSEFGRTPKLNGTGGRDHWSGLVPLLLACDSYPMGRVIGKPNDNAEFALDGVCTPEDLRWTILSHLGFERNNTWHSIEGRPMPITSNHEKNILLDIKV